MNNRLSTHLSRLASVAVLFSATQIGNAQPAPAPSQLPQGGNVIAGDAQINRAGNVMNIDQSSNKAIINWQEFNVGQDARVIFNQPDANAASLNRVLGSKPEPDLRSDRGLGPSDLDQPQRRVLCAECQRGCGWLDCHHA